MIKQFYKFLNPRYQNLFLEYKVDFKPRYGYGNPVHSELKMIIDSNRGGYKDLIYRALSYKEALWLIQDESIETDPDRPTWNNGYLPGLDIIGLYMMLATYKPQKYIEIGSGNSTKVATKQKQSKILLQRSFQLIQCPEQKLIT